MDQRIVRIWQILRIAFVAVPIIAGLDKFTNFLTDWSQYLNPMLAGLLPMSAPAFMKVVGAIEIVAGILVFARPRLGAVIVTAWLVAIALSLLASGRYLDVAVRDLMMALGAFTLATLTPVVQEATTVQRHSGRTAVVGRAAVSLLLGLFLFAAAHATAGDMPGMTSSATVSSKVRFQQDMRKLWEDHITWTRLYIVSAVADLPDKQATAARLLQNQTDIGNAIKPLYGEQAGNQLTALLRDHILVAADLIEKVKSGNDEQAKQVTVQWYSNADSIARFLSTANPSHWAYPEMRSMMHDHLAMTTNEVVARLKQDWQADIAAYSKVHDQILSMADMLSSGIVEQLPDKFR